MNGTEIKQNILLGLLVLIMLGVLWFLYDKTQAIDLREQNEVMSLLNEVKAIDARWDMEVRRARVELHPSQDWPGYRTDAGDKALRDLTRFAQLTFSTSLRSGLPELRSTMQLKAELVQRFKTEDRANKATLQALLKEVSALKAQSPAHFSPALRESLNQLSEVAPQYALHGTEAQREGLQAALARLEATPAAWRRQAEEIERLTRLLLEQIPIEHADFARLEQTTAGLRLVNLSLAFSRELEDLFQEKERYRIYLIYYAAALAILLTYLGFKVKAANQTLEHRVEERTSELSDALKHLKESEMQLIQSEKMASLGQMVAGVAHEINTPLAYMKSSLNQVADKLPAIENTLDHCTDLLDCLKAGNDPEGLAHAFQQTTAHIGALREQHVIEELGGQIKDGLYGTGQIAEIVASLKDFSRMDRSKVAHSNLNECLNNTLLLAKHQLKMVKVNKHLGDIPDITCAPSQINQVLLNLITNAVQALPGERGTIDLTTRVDGDGVAVEVADDGVGIPPEVLPRIFDPFFTTKEVGKGSGLGLSICYKIVQQHGGEIRVESSPAAGTKFTVWLPLTPPTDAQLEG